MIAIPIFFISMFIAEIFKIGTNMDNLRKNSEVLKSELSSLVFIEGRNVNPTALVQGDALTADKDPAQSSYATGFLNTDSPYSVLEQQITTNLAKSGYVREGSVKGLYYSTGRFSSKTEYKEVVLRYVKDINAIRITYQFGGYYPCPTGFVCSYTPESKPTDNIYPESQFGNLIVKKLYINFANKSSDYLTGY